ncbi:MAG: FtsX-like permease family protein [Acidimicrobiia bacterium]|nr:FtsX-like permease family protein [Acidimicrobiia bacterium]
MAVVLLLSRRNLASSRLRVGLTGLAVMFGVAFVVASFVLSDGLRATFNAIVEDVSADIDATVRAEGDFDEVAFQIQTIDEDLLDIVSAVEGVDEALPALTSSKIVPIDSDGEAVETLGPPILAANQQDSPTATVTSERGELPDGPGEFAIDLTSADSYGFEIGESYDIIGVDGREPFTLVGTTRFGQDNALAGAVLMTFTLDEVQRLDGREGKINSIEVTAQPGVSADDLIGNLEAALPEGLEAVGSEVIVEEGEEDFGVIVDIFGNVLLAFALVSVFVSTFIIANTFNILLGQRIRQLALIRALGASKRQVQLTALLEALIVGMIASIVGLAVGVALAYGLRAIMNALGFNLPDLELVISARTIITALVVGIGVSLASALTPSRRAARVPPVAAIREGYRYGSGEGTRRTIIAIILSVLGVSGVVMSLFGSVGSTPLLLLLLGGGAVLVFVAVTMFAPLFSTPSARFLGAPLERLPWLGITGHMARENSSRDNKRTARTAAGLMIGLALIAMATVVASSLKDSFRSSLGSTLTADFLITPPNDGMGFSTNLVDSVDALPELGNVSSVRIGNIRVDGNEHEVRATDLTLLTSLLDVEVLSGDPATNVGPNIVSIHESVATDLNLTVGDELDIEFAATGVHTFTVNAIYDNTFLISNYLIDTSAWDENFSLNEDSVIAASVAEGIDVEAAETALRELQAGFPQLNFETRAEFRDRLEGELDSLLIVINVFLGLAIVIAFLGITNTMALSVLERTREIGLMRAVGMTSRQTRSMIRWEAAVVSLFGALLGVVVGLGFGWIAVQAIPGSIIDQFAVPVPSLVLYVIIATLAGLVAASLPARRASRLKVLDAIHQL